MKWRHKIRPIAKNGRPILIFFARDDAKLMPGEVCQVSCRYSNKRRSYSGKTEGGSNPTPPGGGGLTRAVRDGSGVKIHLPLRAFKDSEAQSFLPISFNLWALHKGNEHLQIPSLWSPIFPPVPGPMNLILSLLLCPDLGFSYSITALSSKWGFSW